MHNTHVHTDTPYVSGRPLQAFYLELELLSSMKKKSHALLFHVSLSSLENLRTV